MTSGEKAEPERSAISSTEHKKHCLTHPFGDPHTDGKCCLCGITREELEKPEKCGYGEHDFKPFQGYRDEPGEPHCLTCGHAQSGCAQHLAEKPDCEHPNKLYTGSVYNGPAGRKTFLFYTCPDCKAHLKEEELDEPEPRCTCGCPKGAHMGKPRGCIPHGFHEYETPEEHNLGPEGVDCVFDACPRDPDDCDNGCRAAADELSREASEAPEDEEGLSGPCDCGEGAVHYTAADCPAEERRRAACQDCLAGVHGPNAHREPPPQPDRRPPYLVAYSVQGHLYEVALPGDATVAALDGRLVITHSLGPVAGICQIAPITNEESTR